MLTVLASAAAATFATADRLAGLSDQGLHATPPTVITTAAAAAASQVPGRTRRRSEMTSATGSATSATARATASGAGVTASEAGVTTSTVSGGSGRICAQRQVEECRDLSVAVSAEVGEFNCGALGVGQGGQGSAHALRLK